VQRIFSVRRFRRALWSVALLPLLTRAAVWPPLPAPLVELEQEARRSNLALAARAVDVEEATARLASARSYFLPRLDLAARYTVADGGRTIDLPLGDLLNGAYATLNQYLASQGQPARFPTLANESIALLRSREQQTNLRLTQPLYSPAISRGVRAARSALAAEESSRAAFARQLRADVIEAYFRHTQAEAAVRIHQAALELVEESLRVTRALAAQEKTTADVVLRATAEVATVRQQLADAGKARDLARGYCNLLLNRAPDTPLRPLSDAELTDFIAELTRTELPALAIDQREELAALQAATRAAVASAEAVDARRRPTLALAAETGIQGASYRTNSDARYSMGSVVLDWNLFDGNQRRGEVAQARAAVRRAELRLAETRRQLELQLQEARDEFLVARAALDSARLRRDAARESHRLVSRREAEGLAAPLTVLDARTTLTAAELNLAVTEARLAISAARLDQAAALSPL